MSTSLKLYTAGPMRRADADSATSEATSRNVEFCNDFNPDTFWEKSTSATQDLKFDLNSTTEGVDTLVLFLRNYSTITSGTVTLVHDDNSSFSSATTVINANTLVNSSTPLRIIDLSSSSSERYWKVTFSNHTIQVGMVLLCQKHTISAGNMFPETETLDYKFKAINGIGGRRYIDAVNSNPIGSIVRSYRMLGNTNYGYAQDAYENARGPQLPVIVWEDTTMANAHLCRFSGALELKQVSYQYYDMTLRFDKIPYIPDGEEY